MTLDRPVHEPETADGTEAPAVAAPLASGFAAYSGLAQMFTPPPILGVSHNRLRRLTPLSLALIPWVVQAQSQEVTPTAGPTGANPPAKPTNLQTSGAHDEVALTWAASTDQTVTRYAILRRNPDADALGVFHLIESSAGPETSYTDGSVSTSSTYIYRVKAISPTGVSQWSGFVKADTPAPPDPEPTPTTTPEPEPEPQTDPASTPSTNLIAALPEGSGLVMSWDAPAEDADCVTGYEIPRAVGPGDLTTLAGEHLHAGRAGGIHMALDRAVHAPGTADRATAPAVALHVALAHAAHGDLTQICTPWLAGGKS